MAKVSRFEDLIAWQRARVLAREIYATTNKGRFARDFGLKDQIERAGVSIMSNIAEGYERGSAADFHQFLTVAKASCAEVRSQLYVAIDVGHITEAEFQKLYEKAEEVGRIVGGLRSSVGERRRAPGRKAMSDDQ